MGLAVERHTGENRFATEYTEYTEKFKSLQIKQNRPFLRDLRVLRGELLFLLKNLLHLVQLSARLHQGFFKFCDLFLEGFEAIQFLLIVNLVWQAQALLLG